ncbi:MAG: DUF4261 domain-containing protein [Planctomycetes bacterium]|nr:DUF4261 domain-containing protein [Planctomycetota bacterium]
MLETHISPAIQLRIPGDWSHPGQMLERIPDGYQLTPESLVTPSGAEISFTPVAPDDIFPQIFRSACRRPAQPDELAILDRYTVNIVLCAPGGSLATALTMMQAAAAFVQAGGAGVFIDNSALAHGGSDWQAMTDDGGSDAISFAYTSIIRGSRQAYTMGMQTMGFPDLVMPFSETNENERGDSLIEILRYICAGDKPVGVGHVIADEQGPRFQIAAAPPDEHQDTNPMHNPYGRLKIVSVTDLAGLN